MLYYCPLEAYEDRYTMQLTKPITGWLESNWRSSSIAYHRVKSITDYADTTVVGDAGQVLNGVLRSQSALMQIDSLIDLISKGKLQSNDVIFFDDFWHPGIEALAYTLHQSNINVPMFAHLYAQTVDAFDFTVPMKRWMRHIEKGYAEILTGIFVANTMLKDLVVEGFDVDPSKVHVTGLLFDANEVKSRISQVRSSETKRNRVIFSSRCDAEKNPRFFIELAERFRLIDPSLEFVICSGRSRDRLTSDPQIKEQLAYAEASLFNFRIKASLTKNEYYRELANAKIQFNCADQDWVSYTLLEAVCAGCFPVYPNTRSFPETLPLKYLYTHKNIESAIDLILKSLVDDVEWSDDAMQARQNRIAQDHALTWKRQASIMGLIDADVDPPFSA